MVLSIVAFYHYGVNRVKLKSLFGLLVVLLTFNLTMLFVREWQHTFKAEEFISWTTKVIGDFSDNLSLLFMMSLDFPYCYNSLMQTIMNVPSKVDYLWGATYGKFFFVFIPRTFWPDKPETISRVVVKYFYPDEYERGVSMSPTIAGEAYFNFGLSAVIVIMIIFGILGRYLYNYFQSNKNDLKAISLYAITLPYFFESIRGYFFEATATYIFLGGAIWFAFRMSSWRRQDIQLM